MTRFTRGWPRAEMQLVKEKNSSIQMSTKLYYFVAPHEVNH